MPILIALLLLTATAMVQAGEAQPDARGLRIQADQARKDNNPADAYALYRRILLEAEVAKVLPDDLGNAVECLVNVNRVVECDALIEAAVTRHAASWRLLAVAAQRYAELPHNGQLVAGAFQRGWNHRRQGAWCDATERDRARALQLMVQAMPLAVQDQDADATGAFLRRFAGVVQRMPLGLGEAWQLQALTDLATLPDWNTLRSQGDRGAPVDAQGGPLFYRVPASWQAAANDGERWRWLLAQAQQAKPQDPWPRQALAEFLRDQFDVHTLQRWGWYERDDQDATEANPFAVTTLRDDETIARLATGVRRFTLPDEFNYIRIFTSLGDAESLARIYENRRQFTKAVAWWTKLGEQGRDQVRQITGNWGTFDPVQTQAAGAQAGVHFRFRNATAVHCTAQTIDVARLLTDVQAMIEARPRNLDWDELDLGDIGRRLVFNDQRRYLTGVAAEWEVKLAPKPGHQDSRVRIVTPLQKAGAYLLSATLADGNTSRIVVWIDDLALVKRHLDDGRTLLWVVDAVSGAPVAEARVACFGYNQRHLRDDRFRIDIDRVASVSDGDGLALIKALPEGRQWLITAQAGDRMAVLGWTGIWHQGRGPRVHDQRKTFVITDRPAYRPGQPVHFKAWRARTRYAEDDAAQQGQPSTIQLMDGRGRKIAEQTLATDAWGAVDGTFTLPADAGLGSWSIRLRDGGHLAFRVEEYKKPEFQVTVDAPAEPVQLGDRLAATITARYYFGAPVTKGTVHYKVLRTPQTDRWYPIGRWDWLYGRGYWWSDYDRSWYPGWDSWGCRRPMPPWWPRNHQPPELVAEGDAVLDAEGRFVLHLDTAAAKVLHGDEDHRYAITAEVTDASRRVITGTGAVVAARKPFTVIAWMDRGWYQAGADATASIGVRMPDGRPVAGTAEVLLKRIHYDAQGVPSEQEVAKQAVDLDADGAASCRFVLAQAGQYRLSATARDTRKRSAEGGCLVTVTGAGAGDDYRFNDLELVHDQREYAAGTSARLLVATSRPGAAVLVFDRPADGRYGLPRVLRPQGRTGIHELALTRGDMPNCFVEAVTVHDGRCATEVRELVVPPEDKALDVRITASAERYKPGTEAQVTVQVTDGAGRPVQGSLALTMYDQALEYISGGPNAPEMRAFFWKWRRNHHPQDEHSLRRLFHNQLKRDEPGMATIGCFGWFAEEGGEAGQARNGARAAPMMLGMAVGGMGMPVGGMNKGMDAAMPMAAAAVMERKEASADKVGEAAPDAPVHVRTNFADAAFWSGRLVTDADGRATVRIPMPENLTGWQLRSWCLGAGTRVGQGAAVVTTAKDVLVRLQTPRFAVERDEVVISANVHSYLPDTVRSMVKLEVDGSCLAIEGSPVRDLELPSRVDQRADWRVRVLKEGEAVVRVIVRAGAESDAMELRFPVQVHGQLITAAVSRAIRPDEAGTAFTLTVPERRRPDQTRLELRWSPTIAGALVDALPYLAGYPHGCTEQTLNRFLPTLVVAGTLKKIGVDLPTIRNKRANLNAQELGDAATRAADWQRTRQRRPDDAVAVWDPAEVDAMVKEGLRKLTTMQLTDGGWGWFSGWGERSSAHLTATVVKGLLSAKANGAAVDQAVIDRGLSWLERHEDQELDRLALWKRTEGKEGKQHADNQDALVLHALVAGGRKRPAMLAQLFEDRSRLTPYGIALTALAAQTCGDGERVAMLMRNLAQFLHQDDANQTAWLDLLPDSWWWWYGDEFETQAAYLKLLAATDPKGALAARLAKYLLTNRKHATYWNSTRDTAQVIDALADFLVASGEGKPDLTLTVLVDGQERKTVTITPADLFGFDDRLVIAGDALGAGEHRIEVRKRGQGPLYVNAWLTTFSLEERMPRQGLEVQVDRAYFKLVGRDRTALVQGAAGQALAEKVEAYTRVPLGEGDRLTSGDLVEVELTIVSKNDYEYLLFADRKPAGCEAVAVQSGHLAGGLPAYAEYRDDRVCLYVHRLPRGRHSLSYRLRAEIPGDFAALPVAAEAMYAPELRANSANRRVVIIDR